MEPIVNGAPAQATLPSPRSFAGLRSRVAWNSHAAAVGIAASLTLAWIFLFERLAIDRHQTFRSHRFDLGNITQAVWSTAHGHPFSVTLASGEQASRLGAHVEPILALFAPLWWIFPSPLLLVCVQVAMLGLGAIPVYRLTQRHTQSELVAVALVTAYLVYPTIQWNALNDFHPSILAIPLLLFAIYYLDQGKLWQFAIFAVLAGATKEQIPFGIALLGLWYAVRRGERVAGAVIGVAALAWGMFNVYVVVPHFAASGHSPFTDRYSEFGGSLGGIASALVHDPVRVFRAATEPDDLAYLILLLIPLGAFWLMEPLLALAAAPQLALNLLSSSESMHEIGYQYVDGIVPFVLAATIIGLGRSHRPVRYAGALVILVLTLGSWVFVQPAPGADPFVWAKRPTEAHLSAIRAALDRVPAGTRVSSTNELGAHLSQRSRIYSFPTLKDAQWAVVDGTDPWLPQAGERNAPIALSRSLKRLRSDPRWTLEFSADRVFVYRRR